MSKIRIYELAKELGLKNKAVLELCVRLEIEGKSSHSNSLSNDEAEKVRRSVIRGALSGGSLTRDRTVNGEVVTERRSGNIIRRKKKSTPEVEPEPLLEEEEEVVDEVEAISESADIVAQEVLETISEEEEIAQSEEVSLVESESVDSEVEVVAEQNERDGEFSQESKSKEDAAALEKMGMRTAKVLGRISLPTKEPRERAVQDKGKEVEVAETTESVRDSKGKKADKKGSRVKGKDSASFPEEKAKDGKRPKKKQVLRRADLLDYDSDRDSWAMRKDKRSKRSTSGSSKNKDVVPTKASKMVIKVHGEIQVGELAHSMGIKSGELIKKLIGLGVMANINQILDFDTVSIVASEFGYSVQNLGTSEEDFFKDLKGDEDKREDLSMRPPVVTVMGHVDHGKTSLLDAIRKTSVTDVEAGGITQHIGASSVNLPDGSSVTFLDTPGHEAFTAMRGRGASVTDVVVLVVAADDGVMPQTIEAINHAKAAQVPIVVALNKIDKPDANQERIMTQLAEHGLAAEQWGGETIMVPVSAITGEGLDILLENLTLQAEILELKANSDRDAIGTVIESRLDKGRGAVMTVLVQNGTLKRGDSFIAGSIYGKIRALVDSAGVVVDSAGPSTAVEVLGASSCALAGDEFFVVKNDAEAKKVTQIKSQKDRSKELSRRSNSGSNSLSFTLENFSQFLDQGELKELPIVLKADVQGSAEALRSSLERLSNEEVKINIIHSAVGGISDNDIQLAVASGAIVIGFNVRAETSATKLAQKEGVDVRYSRVIYEIVENIEAAIVGLLDPEYAEKVLGRAEIRQVFKVPKIGAIAGCYVVDGNIERGSLVRLLRDGAVLYEGKMGSLRRFKEDTKQVQAGYECGIGIDGYGDIKEGDLIEVFRMEEKKPQLPSSAGV